MYKTLVKFAVSLSLVFTALNVSATAGISVVYKTSADELWKLVDFHQPSENIMPPIASSKRDGDGVGATKINMLNGGGEVHLQLVYYSAEDRAFNYVIQSSPLPVSNYVGQVRIESLGEDRARLSWQGVYDAAGVSQEEADAILQGFLDSIAMRIGEKFPQE